MRELHEANKRWWNITSDSWKERAGDVWRKCLTNPEIGLKKSSLELIEKFVGKLVEKSVCVLASGDNLAAFVLAGLGAQVTSVDFSDDRLKLAESRAQELGLKMTFKQSDVTNIDEIPDDVFDLALSTEGVMVWISELGEYYREATRILKPNGIFISYDIHPFQRPWADYPSKFEMIKPYSQYGPIQFPYDILSGKVIDRSKDVDHKNEDNYASFYNFHWTMSQLIVAMIESGLEIQYIKEDIADSQFWQPYDFQDSTISDADLWQKDSRAGLPAWLTLVGKRK
jgi:ubiquinone/menaquinone biosynthesis C-methylase UbiE